ncbi:MAG: DUF1156 domain-containing protein [candidate division Zixibacteria bacterium]|nr:DUF1156 domain-containing protein [candidate division Zixibacteria bacterium]
MKTHRYCKRLIEVDLPIKRISEHARREKSIRHGHISTLHLWWARRPLAACRAVICASLWPDPADDLCPIVFRKAAKNEMMVWGRDSLKLMSDESYKFFRSKLDNPCCFDDPINLRKALLHFIADYSNWDHTNNSKFNSTSNRLTKAAYQTEGTIKYSRPLVVDPFAGGGAIPLESLRVGADAYASDLNPVAVLINKVLLEYIPQYGTKLSTAVKEWGLWINKQASKRLSVYYPPTGKDLTPLAYIWARTIISESPSEKNIPIEIPLISSMWLSKKPHRKRALRWVLNKGGRVATKILYKKYANGINMQIQQPLLEVFEPKNISDVPNGNVARGSATCPVTGYTVPVKNVRIQLEKRKGGASDARMICTVSVSKIRKGRTYCIPTNDDLETSEMANVHFNNIGVKSEENSNFPNEPTPPRNSHRAVSSFPIYGMNKFIDLFTPRQALVLKTFTELIKEAGNNIEAQSNKEFAFATQSCLALLIGKIADYCSSLTPWASPATQETVRNTFGRQALAMVWDFAEANIFAKSSGGWCHALEYISRAIEHTAKGINSQGTANIEDACQLSLPDNIAAALITDPPYYDSIPYAELSDYFYVWLKRAIPDCHASLFKDVLTPKKEQIIVWHPNAVDEKDRFQDLMKRALSNGRRILNNNGIGIVVFAHKSTSGWESQLRALIESDWIITASWPIDTERSGRINAKNTASLASSVHLICRPRENTRGTKLAADIGDWRDLLTELPERIHEWMPRLAGEGVVGADAIFACLGPALEIYSRYSSVERASGEEVSLSEYLEEVWATVSREALNMIFEGADSSGFEEDARLTAMWLWTISTGVNGQTNEEDKPISSLGYTLEFDAARKIAQGLGVHLERLMNLVEIQGDKARLIPVSERSKYLFGKEGTESSQRKRKKKDPQIGLGFLAELEESEEQAKIKGSFSVNLGKTVLDQLHQCMLLFAAGRSEALKRLIVEEGVGRDQRFWKLAQSLSALYPKNVDEKRWVDGVLAKKKSFGF